MNFNNNSIQKSTKKSKGLFYNFWYDFVKLTGSPAYLYLRPKVYRPFDSKLPKGAVLISSNHPSFLDPLTIMCVFPWRRVHSLATKDLYKNKLLTLFFNKVHCIPVDKNNFSMSAFHDVTQRLIDGHAVMIFPEGKVHTDNTSAILAYKSGVVLMAHKSGAPIIPVYIAGREKWYHRQIVIIGQEIDVCEILGQRPSMDSLNNVTEMLREKENELKTYYENNIKEK